MDFVIFQKMFNELCLGTRFAPDHKDIKNVQTWHSMVSRAMNDMQIKKAFWISINEHSNFPTFEEFKNRGDGIEDVDTQTDKIMKTMLASLAKGGDPTSSTGFLKECGPIAYQAIGGHMGWYDIMMGNKRMPREKELRFLVRALVSEQVKSLKEGSPKELTTGDKIEGN